VQPLVKLELLGQGGVVEGVRLVVGFNEVLDYGASLFVNTGWVSWGCREGFDFISPLTGSDFVGRGDGGVRGKWSSPQQGQGRCLGLRCPGHAHWD
jgi:hypothetical protein